MPGGIRLKLLPIIKQSNDIIHTVNAIRICKVLLQIYSLTFLLLILKGSSSVEHIESSESLECSISSSFLLRGTTIPEFLLFITSFF